METPKEMDMQEYIKKEKQKLDKLAEEDRKQKEEKLKNFKENVKEEKKLLKQGHIKIIDSRLFVAILIALVLCIALIGAGVYYLGSNGKFQSIMNCNPQTSCPNVTITTGAVVCNNTCNFPDHLDLNLTYQGNWTINSTQLNQTSNNTNSS